METLKEKRVRETVDFFRKLNLKGAVFIGISGSVSYEPMEGDDVDIFLITEDFRLWTTVLATLVFRRIMRFNDLCLSLCMDTTFAVDLFSNMEEGIAAKDSTMVIPIKGGEYFRSLLAQSDTIRKKLRTVEVKGPAEKLIRKASPSLVELISFIVVSSWVNVKSLIISRRDMKVGQGGFRTIFSFHKFYYDTDKYREINEKYMKEVINFEKNSDNI